MRKAHNRIELDHAYIFEQWKNGKTSDILAKELGVTPIVIFRHLRETAGDNYEALAKEHWKNLAAKRSAKYAGSKRTGAPWFTPEQEKDVVKFFFESTENYEGIAKHFGCSRIVIKKVIERLVSSEDRKTRNNKARQGKRIAEYIKKECPVCHKMFEMPPWVAKTNKIHCSQRCKGLDSRGENSPSYGKINHAIGAWYNTLHCEVWFRSQWEYVVATYLDRQGQKWRYEPKAFEIVVDEKKTTYTPDFYLVDKDRYIEVKGYWRPAYIAKHKVFRETYPDIKIEVWDKDKLLELGLINKKHHIIMPQPIELQSRSIPYKKACQR